MIYLVTSCRISTDWARDCQRFCPTARTQLSAPAPVLTERQKLYLPKVEARLRDLPKNYFSSPEEARHEKRLAEYELAALDETGFWEGLNPAVAIPNLYRRTSAKTRISQANLAIATNKAGQALIAYSANDIKGLRTYDETGQSLIETSKPAQEGTPEKGNAAAAE